MQGERLRSELGNENKGMESASFQRMYNQKQVKTSVVRRCDLVLLLLW